VGQQHRFAVPVRGPADGRRGLRFHAPGLAPEARHDFRRMYGRVAARRGRLHERVHRRPGPAVRDDAHRRLYNVHVFRPTRHPADALDIVWRGFSDGSKR